MPQNKNLFSVQSVHVSWENFKVKTYICFENDVQLTKYSEKSNNVSLTGKALLKYFLKISNAKERLCGSFRRVAPLVEHLRNEKKSVIKLQKSSYFAQFFLINFTRTQNKLLKIAFLTNFCWWLCTVCSTKGAEHCSFLGTF